MKVHRTDLLPSNLTDKKANKIRDMLSAYRAGAVLIGKEQWKLFFQTGSFNSNYDKNKINLAFVVGAANRVQMARHQVVGQLQSWVSNRANDFRDLVTHSTLSDEQKYMLYTVNVKQAWFSPADVLMKNGSVVLQEMRKLARKIFHHAMGKHRRPDLSRISMWLDQRCAIISKPIKAAQRGKVAYWVKLSTMEKASKRILIPLLGYQYHLNRKGKLANGIQINLDRNNDLSFGLVTDIGEECAKSRDEYKGKGEIGIDFGLTDLFATSDGQFLGPPNWFEKLKKYDKLICMIVASQQRAGKKPRESTRYRDLVRKVRGYIKTEINTALNRFIEKTKPNELVLEKLNFQNQSLSSRLNRIIGNCGRAIVNTKLADLKDRKNIKINEVNPAYSSQTCSACDYVDRRNRMGDKFRCLWCGKKMHAGLNAAKVLRERRASPIGLVRQSKAAVLEKSVRAFLEKRFLSFKRWKPNGKSGVPADPRLTNKYFVDFGEVN